MGELSIEPVTIYDGDVELVKGVDFSVAPGEMVALIGPNGAGKTSLLRGLLGLLPPTTGGARVGGQWLHAMSPTRRARTVAWLPQSVPLAWPIKVQDAVALGRFAHGGSPQLLSSADNDAITAAMAACEVTPLVQRSTATLSGGELARVHLARALAAQTPWLFADEPVAALDPAHRIAVMQRLRDHAQANNVGMIIVLHDLDLAARFCDRLVAIRHGQLLFDGTPSAVIKPAMIRALFDVDASVDYVGGWPRLTVAAAPATS
jgi:iron complex transport system ATP-binding protein